MSKDNKNYSRTRKTKLGRLLAGIDLEVIDLQIKIAQGQRKVDRLFLLICVGFVAQIELQTA